MSKLKIYAVWSGAKDEAAQCVAVLDSGERLGEVTAVNEDDARQYIADGHLNDVCAAAILSRSTPVGPSSDPSFMGEHGVTYDSWELEFVGEADRSRYPQIAAMLGLI